MSTRISTCLLGFAGIAVLAACGAIALEFLCDDAFIVFRYVANAREGHGLVWNAPPFAPVEGYTCFLWAALLWATWSWAGIEPPVSANWWSLAFGLGQLSLLAMAAMAIRARDGQRLPRWLVMTTVVVLASNRTFLQWWTGGLETSMFHLFLLGWVLWAFRWQRESKCWLAVWSFLAALAALTRPDGLLLVAATAAVALALVRQRGISGSVVGLAPLGLVVAHLAWRRSFYGEWLPNTYYAKVGEAWPEAGWRYLSVFAIENGVWLLPVVAVPALLVWGIDAVRRPGHELRGVLAPSAAIAVLLVHVSYYVLRVGGDHFEYRVFAHLPPLCCLAITAMAARCSKRTLVPAIATISFGIASSAGWVHLVWTRDMPPHGFQPIAARAPRWVEPLARWYDRQQAWLLFHKVGVRRERHARVFDNFRTTFSRRMNVEAGADGVPVLAAGSVGIAAWSLPNCAVIDLHGLNDWVVARTRTKRDEVPIDAGRWRPTLVAADIDRDGNLDRTELRTLLGFSGGGSGPLEVDGVDFFVETMLAIHARTLRDAVTLEESEGIARMLLRTRWMAHERTPPPGYLSMFDANVRVGKAGAVKRSRAVPLTAARIRAIEAAWRSWIEGGAKPDERPLEQGIR